MKSGFKGLDVLVIFSAILTTETVLWLPININAHKGQFYGFRFA